MEYRFAKRGAAVLIFLILSLLIITLTGCDAHEPTPDASDTGAGYTNITALEAEEMMTDDAVIVDVRNQDEFDQGHIPNAILLPVSELSDSAENVLPDKNQVILLYCRLGVRSSTAAQELAKLGYTRVYNFGGIIDWHGEIVRSD